MGLENLKSVFTEGFQGMPTTGKEEKIGKSALENLSEKEYAKFQFENLGKIGSEVDFFSGENSYKTTLNPSIAGFTNFFNLGGYSFSDNQLGNSKFLFVTSDAQKRKDLDISLYSESLTTNKLGFGDYSSDTMYGNFEDDFRFNLFGFLHKT